MNPEPAIREGDPHQLERFIRAQASDYQRALAEIRAGQKRSHWMWYVFPQWIGLGSSPMAERYAIRSRSEAEAYLAHPVLGQRLRECSEALLGIESRSASQIFGDPDDLKLRSCATLFAAVSPPGSVFDALLAKYFRGQPDSETLRRLSSSAPP